MIFVGKRESGFFAEEFCTKKNLPFEYVTNDTSILHQTNKILMLGKQDFSIFDITEYCDDPDTIFQEINRICAANTSQCIIFAPGYTTKMKLIDVFIEHGIKKIIFSINLSDMKDELEKCINGYKDSIDYSIKEKEIPENMKSTDTYHKLIGIAGVCSRIGTTTHAIQLVKYLQFIGKKACYIEMNSSKNIEKMLQCFAEIDNDEESGCIHYENVDHYYKVEPEYLDSILKKDYEYFIYDYGIYSDPKFNRISFTEKNYKLLVVGNEADEILQTVNFIESSFYSNIKYIFNFCSKNDETDIKELMEGDLSDVFISPYIPNKYSFSELQFYEELLPIEADEGEKKKRKFFWRRRNE